MEYKSSETGPGGVDSQLLEVACTRDVNGNNFSKGVQDYPFSVGGAWSFVPAKSYFRMRCTVTNADTSQPTTIDNIALADGFCNNLFNNAYFRAGQQDVSQITSFLPQAAMVKHRLHKSGAWTKTVGSDSQNLEPSFRKRVHRIASNGSDPLEPDLPYLAHLPGATVSQAQVDANGDVVLANASLFANIKEGDTFTIAGDTAGPGGGPTTYTVVTAPIDDDGSTMVAEPETASSGQGPVLFKRPNPRNYQKKNQLEFIFQPPLGIFDYDQPMYGGDYRISLNPISNFQQAAIESLHSLSSTAGNFKFEVTDLHFYVALVRMNNPLDSVIRLNLTECAIQTKAYSKTLDFTVPPSTFGIAVYLQDTAAGSDTRVPPNIFKLISGEDEDLRQFQMTYANISKPSTDWSTELGDGKNYMIQRYYDTLSNAGLTLESGGTETFADWLSRGGLYFYTWLRDSSDRSTHLQIRTSYGAQPTSALVHVCALYSKVAEISSSNGRITAVSQLAV